jgi:hypothetical protein
MDHDDNCENLRGYPEFPCDCDERKKLEHPINDMYDNPLGEYPAL